MNRKLLTGLTIACVAGTGGAAYASVAEPADNTPAATSAVPLVTATESSTTEATSTSAATTTTIAAVGRTIAYQVGDAGTVTVDVAGSVMTSRGLVPASGWKVEAMSNSGAHIDVQFSNSERVVGFSADLVGADVVISVTNDRLPGAPGPINPLTVSVVGGSNTPAAGPAPVTEPSLDTVVPSSAETYGDDDGDDYGDDYADDDEDDEDDDHEYESNDGGDSSHSDESEGGDDD